MAQSQHLKATTGPLYFCYGGEHSFTFKAEADSPWINQGVKLDSDPMLPTLPFTSTPPNGDYQTFADAGVTWAVNCSSAASNAEAQPFQLWVQTEYTSPAYKIEGSLGHHRLEFVDVSGYEQFQVIEYQEQATLNAREVSFYDKQLPMPFEAKWVFDGTEFGTDKPDADGWVTGLFKPATEGKHTIKLQVPSLYYENGYAFADVMVHALYKTPWNNNATLELNSKPLSDVADLGLICTRGRSNTLKLVNPDLLLSESTLTLSSATDLAALGIIIPDLGLAKPVNGPTVEWLINSSTTGGKSGFFELELACSKLKKNWTIAARVISENLADEVSKIEVRDRPISGVGALFLQDEPAVLRLTFEPWMRGLNVKLTETGASPGNFYEPALNTSRAIPDNLQLEWKVTAKTLGTFTLQAICDGHFTHPPLTPLHILCRVRSEDIAKEFKSIVVSGSNIASYELPFSEPGLLIPRALSTSGQLKIKINTFRDGALIGQTMKLGWLSGDLGVAPTSIMPGLNTEYEIVSTGTDWTWVRSFQIRDGFFQLDVQCDGAGFSLPGISFGSKDTDLVAGMYYGTEYYSMSHISTDPIRVKRDGTITPVRVIMNKESPLFKLFPTWNFTIALNSEGPHKKVIMRPPSGSSVAMDPNGEEFTFDIGGEANFSGGGSFIVIVTFSYGIPPINIHCLI
jgi:hypothetical protein